MREKFISERRLTVRATRYWEMLKGETPLPNYARLSSAAIGDIYDFCFIVSVRGESDRYYYTYKEMGQEIVRMFGQDLRGQVVSSNFKFVPAQRLIKKFDECIKTATPVDEEGHFVNHKNQVIKYRSCALPFGDSDGHVDHIMAAISWQAH